MDNESRPFGALAGGIVGLLIVLLGGFRLATVQSQAGNTVAEVAYNGLGMAIIGAAIAAGAVLVFD